MSNIRKLKKLQHPKNSFTRASNGQYSRSGGKHPISKVCLERCCIGQIISERRSRSNVSRACQQMVGHKNKIRGKNKLELVIESRLNWNRLTELYFVLTNILRHFIT